MDNGEFLDRGDVRLHYRLSGRGVPVLLIQGVGVVGGAWQPQIDYLASSNYATLVFDNRGIGRSLPCRGPITIEAMAEDTKSLMDHLKWDSAHIVGHSMGGVIAQQLALSHPTRVRSLSLLCTFARGKEAARPMPWVLWMSLRTRIGSRPMRRRAFLEMLIPKDDLPAEDQDALASEIGGLIGRDLATNPPILFKQLRAMARHDCFSRLRELAGIPTVVLSAEHDRIALPRFGRSLADAVPGAQFEQIPAASHGVIIYKPDTINQRLRAFLDSVEQL